MGFGFGVGPVHIRSVCVELMNRAAGGGRAAVSGSVEVSTWVTATIARLLGVAFGEIRAAAQAGRVCHGE